MRTRQASRTLVLTLLLLLSAGATASGQIVRPPELSLQFHRAEAAWKSGASVLEAKARLDKVVDALPDDVPARKLRAQVLMAMNRPEEALEDARRAAALRPADGEAHLILSEAARLSGRRDLALEALDAAADRLLDDADLHIRLSWNAEALGQLDKAEAFARIALALDQHKAAAYYQLARVFALQDKQDEAAEILSRGLRASVLQLPVIARDSVLNRVIDHPALGNTPRR